QYIVNWKDGRQSFEAAATDKEFVDGFLTKNKNDVLFAEPDYKVYPQVIKNNIATVALNSAESNWGAARIHADVAWAQNIKGEGITVAVIDAGIQWDHPQIKNQLLVNMAEL